MYNQVKQLLQRNMREATQIANQILKSHPQTEYYSFERCSADDANQSSIYVALTAEEKKLIEGYYQKDEQEREASISEYLEVRDQDEFLARLMHNDNPYYNIDIVESCDLSKIYYSIRCKLFIKNEGNWALLADMNMMVLPKEFKQLLVLGILAKRPLSVNELVYKMPKLAQRWMSDIAWALGNGLYESNQPFALEIVDFFDLIPNIEKD